MRLRWWDGERIAEMGCAIKQGGVRVGGGNRSGEVGDRWCLWRVGAERVEEVLNGCTHADVAFV